MEELLYKDFVQVTSPRPASVATDLATFSIVADSMSDPIRDSVGRPGLDPGTVKGFRRFRT
jgi:hypothetical protein